MDLAVLKGHLWKNAQGWDPEGIVSTLTRDRHDADGHAYGISPERGATRAGESRRASLPGEPSRPRRASSWDALFRSTRISGPRRTWSSRPAPRSSALASASSSIDVLGWKKPFAFFFTFGTNPLLVFVLSGLLAKTMGLVKWTDAAGKVVTLHAWVYRGGLLLDRGPDAALARLRARHDPLLVGRPARLREERLVLEDLSHRKAIRYHSAPDSIWRQTRAVCPAPRSRSFSPPRFSFAREPGRAAARAGASHRTRDPDGRAGGHGHDACQRGRRVAPGRPRRARQEGTGPRDVSTSGSSSSTAARPRKRST